MDWKYKNHSNRFCYICGHVVLQDPQAKITDIAKKAYLAYFGVKPGDQVKPFVPHICCKTCVENLRDGSNKNGRVCYLVSQWCGGIMLRTATFVWQI